MADAPIDAVIEVRANTAKLDGDLAAAKARAEAGGAGADAAAKATAATTAQTTATSKLGDELRKVKKTYGEQIEVVQGLIGKFAAIGGIATLAFKAGQAIREYIIEALKDAGSEAEDFIDKLDFNKPRENAEKLQQRLIEVNSELAFAVEQQAEALADERTALFVLERRAATTREVNRLKEEAARLEEKLIAALGQANALEDKTGQKAKDAQDLEDKQREQKRRDDFDTLIRMEEEAQKGRWRIEDEQQKRREAFEDYMAGIAEAARAQEEAARKVQQTWAQTFRQIREENNRAFATDQAASMVQLAAQLRTEGTIASANMARIVVEGVG